MGCPSGLDGGVAPGSWVTIWHLLRHAPCLVFVAGPSLFPICNDSGRHNFCAFSGTQDFILLITTPYQGKQDLAGPIWGPLPLSCYSWARKNKRISQGQGGKGQNPLRSPITQYHPHFTSTAALEAQGIPARWLYEHAPGARHRVTVLSYWCEFLLFCSGVDGEARTHTLPWPLALFFAWPWESFLTSKQEKFIIMLRCWNPKAFSLFFLLYSPSSENMGATVQEVARHRTKDIRNRRRKTVSQNIIPTFSKS